MEHTAIDIDTSSVNNNTKCYNVCPKSLIIYLSQVIILMSVVCVSMYNLSINHPDKTLWSSLLSSSIGYVLPAPKMRKNKAKTE